MLLKNDGHGTKVYPSPFSKIRTFSMHSSYSLSSTDAPNVQYEQLTNSLYSTHPMCTQYYTIQEVRRPDATSGRGRKKTKKAVQPIVSPPRASN